MQNSAYTQKRIISSFIKTPEGKKFNFNNSKVVYFKKHLAYRV